MYGSGSGKEQQRSGEIFGVLKQLQEEMKGALSEAQKTEAARAATFAELRSAKTSDRHGPKGGVINYQKSDFSLKIDILLHNWASK